MNGENAFEKRRSSLENQFFSEVDEKLLAKLRRELSEREQIDALMAATGIKDRNALSGLVKLGMSEDTVLALRLVPLVATAWADGMIEENERYEVSRIAEIHGIHPDQPSGKLLAHWLSHQPPDDLFDNWEACARDLVQSLPAQAAAELRHTLMSELKSVAQAAGGILGWGSVSPSENSVLNRADAALRTSAK